MFVRRFFSHKYDWPLNTVVLNPCSMNLKQQQSMLFTCESPKCPPLHARACFAHLRKALGNLTFQRPFMMCTQEEERCCHPTSHSAHVTRRGWERTHFLITSVMSTYLLNSRPSCGGRSREEGWEGREGAEAALCRPEGWPGCDPTGTLGSSSPSFFFSHHRKHPS